MRSGFKSWLVGVMAWAVITCLALPSSATAGDLVTAPFYPPVAGPGYTVVQRPVYNVPVVPYQSSYGYHQANYGPVIAGPVVVQRPVIVRRPVVVYRTPVSVMPTPVVTYYAPPTAFAAPAPYYVGRPAYVGRPVYVGRPAYVGRSIYWSPKVYVQGQPVRNLLRAVTP